MALEDQLRGDNEPVGLKNIGNTCYFNSLLQIYYHLPEFVKTILTFDDDGKPLQRPTPSGDELEAKADEQ